MNNGEPKERDYWERIDDFWGEIHGLGKLRNT